MDNRPDTGPGARTENGADVVRWVGEEKDDDDLRTEDKLDAAPATVAAVSGPEDVSGWHAVDWRACENNVRRLRQRIFTASMAGDLPRVRRLQRLMLRSRSNTLMSVRRVTERNAGRLTAGVDGEIVLTAEAKLTLPDRVAHPITPFQARPVRRVYIPKAGSKKQRPLGIPVILDRAHQARVVNALEPEWEARFEPRSYGFRPGRGCHDAIQATYQTVKGANPRRRWVLDADLAGAFDQIAHAHILNQLGSFPARGMIDEWLRAGVVENGQFFATEEGTPRGGVISPVLLNVALHGIEQAAGVHYARCGTDAARSAAGSPTLIRYADDLIALCHTRQQAIEVKARLAAWLASRGLVFNEDKTRVVTLEEGFDFLGFHVRRYRGRPLIKPSKTATRRIRERLRTELRSLRGHNARAVIRRLNPIIRGWAAYYRTQVSSHTFKMLDQYLWQLTYKWALVSHRNRSRPWVFAHCFGRFNRTRQDRWVFGDRATGAYLHRFSWTGIVRHQIVPGTASVDDPALGDFWTKRRSKAPLPITSNRLRLYQAQNGRCPICKTALLRTDQPPPTPTDWERWLATARDTITIATTGAANTPDKTDHRLIHANCRPGRQPDTPPAPDPNRPA